MTYALYTHLEAEEQLAEALAWHEEINSSLCIELQIKIDEALQRIADNPFAYPVMERAVRRLVLTKFRYAIFFEVIGDYVYILAVLHTSRSPRLWPF